MRAPRRLTSVHVSVVIGVMVPLKRVASVAGALVVVAALASTSVVRHHHGPDTQSAGHADCDVCHFRHLPVIETDSAPAPSAPDLVAHAVPSDGSKGKRGAVVGIRPTRGPPA